MNNRVQELTLMNYWRDVSLAPASTELPPEARQQPELSAGFHSEPQRNPIQRPKSAFFHNSYDPSLIIHRLVASSEP